ncbi:unknown protein [Seminavis robusta]|uniref:Major facilitator superfamily (MFS) profile domain-containing protein n=1 Tax=Seminavis robusta TaxID=568900 RepID=A0A9N8EPK9_9STRA|nr:unknown protein [Seminavis robusta]|eukprot:Sro1345_g264800.1 n/a (544) ;mRNA; f:19797-21428
MDFSGEFHGCNSRTSTLEHKPTPGFDASTSSSTSSSSVFKSNEKSSRNWSDRGCLVDRARDISIRVCQLSVFCDYATSTILRPNFPFLALPGAHEESFPSTEPFGFSAATYFLPFTFLLGAAICSPVMGPLSDPVGRKPCIVFSLVVTALGAVVKYLVRQSFWGFCVANFAHGLIGGGTAPVSLAYASDVSISRHQKDAEIAFMTALSMIGMASGGVIAILMGDDQSLFAPLLVGAGSCAFSAMLVVFLVYEPSTHMELLTSQTDSRHQKPILVGSDEEPVTCTKQLRETTEAFDDEASEIDVESPVKVEPNVTKTGAKDHGKVGIPPPAGRLNQKVVFTIIVGALVDNLGSAGLTYISISPMAFNAFYHDFVSQGQEPIMSADAFKLIQTLLALAVVPGAVAAPKIVQMIGSAGACVLANIMTAVVIAALLGVTEGIDPSPTSYAAFVTILYSGFSLAVISQVSTGTMLDAIAPDDKRGYVQGLNLMSLNLASAVCPYLLGELADRTGTAACMWTNVGISVLAAVVNSPLLHVRQLQRQNTE